MTYRVVKKINGSHYLYEQETYREGGKVRTRSSYIGPVDGKEYKRLKSRGEPIEAALIDRTLDTPTVEPTLEPEPEIKITVTAMSPQPKPSKQKSPPHVTPPTPKRSVKPVSKLNTTNKRQYTTKALPKLPLKIRAKVERHHISRTALEAEHRRFLAHLTAKGLDASKIGRVLIGTGKRVQAKRRRSGNYVVTVPRWKTKTTRRKKSEHRPATGGTRVDFKREYRKALAGTYLDAIKAQDPQYYAGLELNLKTAFKAQNKAITHYIRNSKFKGAHKIGLTLHFMQSKMLSNWSKAHIAAEKVGFVDHERRDTWQQDAIAMMSEIQKHGWNKAYQKYCKELAQTESLTLRTLGQYRKAGLMDKLSGKRRAKRKEFRKLNARRKALVAACDKISVLSPLYQDYKDHVDGMAPFRHEEDWKVRKKRWKKRQSLPA